MSVSDSPVRGGALPARPTQASEKPTLHFVTLMLSLLVAASLGWAGSPLWVWLGGSALLAGGHIYCWLTRRGKPFLVSILVLMSVVASTALLSRTISQALAGDWLAVAHYLLLFHGLAGFEMRTRGGLHARVVLNGAVFFFVGLEVVDLTFGMFLTGFTTLLLSYLALSFLLDQVKEAQVYWFGNRYAFLAFWTGVFVAAMVVSAAVFAVLPKRLVDPVGDPDAAILPMRATSAPVGREDIPDLALPRTTLPVTGDARPGQAVTPAGDGPGTEGASGLASGGAGGGDSPDRDASSTGRVAFGPDARSSEPAGTGDPVVMRVRSPVLTYWRDAVYGAFDGRYWYADPDTWELRSQTAERSVYAVSQPANVELGPRYVQTFHVEHALQGQGATGGYTPLIVSFPAGAAFGEDLPAGTSYRVISTIPDFSRETLKEARPNSRHERRYHELPDHLSQLRIFSLRLTGRADTDWERAQRLVAFLDSNYHFDASAPDQLAPTAGITEFLHGQRPGTSIDFAAATVLLARGSGIPARLATGYLPGAFDPLSGTYAVRDSDRHAWAEMYFNEAGWVPFDAAPVPSAIALGEGGSHYTEVDSIFEAGYGDAAIEAMRAAPELLSSISVRDVVDRVAAFAAPIVAVLALLLLMLAVWRLRPRSGLGSYQSGYARLPGHERAELLHIYLSAERALARLGVGLRSPAQTMWEYTSRVEGKLGDAVRDLAYLRQMAWAAAYDPAPFEGIPLRQARRHGKRIRAAVASFRRGQDYQAAPPPKPKRRYRTPDERWPKKGAEKELTE